MPGNDYVTYSVEDRTALIRIDRAEKMNALNDGVIDGIMSSLEHAEEDDDLRAIVLTGSDEIFSAGYDLGQAGGSGSPSVEALLDRYSALSEFILSVHEHELPTIAAVNGHAIAGGSDLALACDLTFASERAEIGYPGIRMGGSPPTLIYPFVMGSIKHAKEMLYSGKKISASRAEAIGMINRAVPHDELMDVVRDEVTEIKKVPKSSVRINKHVLNGVMEMQGFRPSVRTSQRTDALAHATDEGKTFYDIRDAEGVNAAIEWMNEVEK